MLLLYCSPYQGPAAEGRARGIQLSTIEYENICKYLIINDLSIFKFCSAPAKLGLDGAAGHQGLWLQVAYIFKFCSAPAYSRILEKTNVDMPVGL